MSNASKASAGWGFLALELDGATAGAAVGTAGAPGGTPLAAAVLAAESAGFHAVTFRDSPEAGRLNALQRAAFAGPLTRSIAVIPEVDTAYTEPFHVSTQLASLDYVTGGRAGWIATADDDGAAAAAVGRRYVTGEGLAHEAAASIEVSRRLWDSWEDDAVIRDVASGRYLDAGKLHYADFEGPGYSVKGPSIIPRPLQGQLPVFVPASLAGDDLVEPSAVDAVLVSAPTPELLADEVREVRERLGGRAPAVVVELDVVLDARGQSAAQRLAGEGPHGPALPGTAPHGSALPRSAALRCPAPAGPASPGRRLRWLTCSRSCSKLPTVSASILLNSLLTSRNCPAWSCRNSAAAESWSRRSRTAP